MKIYYKVVRRVGNQLMSSRGELDEDLSSPWKVLYRKGHWSKPKINYSRLFVFNSLQSAQEFILPYKTYGQAAGLEIWECIIEGRGNIYPAQLYWNEKNNKTISEYWKSKQQHRKSIREIRYINGSCSAKRVKLIKKIG